MFIVRQNKIAMYTVHCKPQLTIMDTYEWSIFLHCIVSAVQFIFIPSPNIGVNQPAHYQCSVDHNGVLITWTVNETSSANNKIIQLGIVTNGAGSSNSSLTIPGYPQYNNTVVRCHGFGEVDGNNYNNFSESTLRIQGNTLYDICHYISSH